MLYIFWNLRTYAAFYREYNLVNSKVQKQPDFTTKFIQLGYVGVTNLYLP